MGSSGGFTCRSSSLAASLSGFAQWVCRHRKRRTGTVPRSVGKKKKRTIPVAPDIRERSVPPAPDVRPLVQWVPPAGETAGAPPQWVRSAGEGAVSFPRRGGRSVEKKKKKKVDSSRPRHTEKVDSSRRPTTKSKNGQPHMQPLPPAAESKMRSIPAAQGMWCWCWAPLGIFPWSSGIKINCHQKINCTHNWFPPTTSSKNQFRSLQSPPAHDFIFFSFLLLLPFSKSRSRWCRAPRGGRSKKKKRSIPVAPDVGLWAARGQVPLVRARRIGRCVRGSPFFENTIQKWGPKII